MLAQLNVPGKVALLGFRDGYFYYLRSDESTTEQEPNSSFLVRFSYRRPPYGGVLLAKINAGIHAFHFPHLPKRMQTIRLRVRFLQLFGTSLTIS